MSITIVGLGPSGLANVDAATLDLLADPASAVILRTGLHPGAKEVLSMRSAETCDDLYESLESFDDVYAAVAARVVEAAADGTVVYAVPGSPAVGERTVGMIVALAEDAGIDVGVKPAMSFLDLAYVAVGVDPIADGVQVLDARDLPDPLPLHVPTIITQVDSSLRSGDVALALGRTLPDDTHVTVLDRLGDDDAAVTDMPLHDLAAFGGGARASVFVPAHDAGLLGLVATNRILRASCPWDMKQTHHSLLSHLVEEAYETADALGRLPADAPGGEPDFGAYAEVEDELGDLLLQVVFHSTLAAEAGAFDIDEVAEINRRKLVRRHPHVFGEVEVTGADEVLSNWETIKQAEKSRTSLMDDVPTGMPAVARAVKVQKRAASVGFDWDEAEPVFAVLASEVEELREAADDADRAAEELGDILFAAINLARHLRVDPEIALRGAVDRFMVRFRHVEAEYGASGRSMREASLDELDAAWHRAKIATSHTPEQSA